MKTIITPGSIDVSLIIFVSDSSSIVGAGLAGLLYNASGLTCYYVRPGSAAAQLTLATQTVTGAHSDGGFIQIDSTNMPGVYRLDLSDAIIAPGVANVVLLLKGAANMVSLPIEIQLGGEKYEIGTATGTPTTTQATFTGLGDLTTDHYKDSLFRVLTGSNAGEVKKITASVNSGGNVQLTFGAMSAALVSSDKIMIINI